MSTTFPDGPLVDRWRVFDDGPPDVGRYEFVVPPCADVDLRCTCRFLGFLRGGEDDFGDEGAWFAWTEGCPVHRDAPFVKMGDRVKVYPKK